jgi:hypothetical protein
MIFEVVYDMCATGSFFKNKFTRHNVVLMLEMLHETGVVLEHLAANPRHN